MSNYLPTMRQKNFLLSNFLLYHLISSHRRLYGLITIWWRKTFWDLITNPIVMNRFASCSNISHRIIITLYSTYKFSCFLGMHIISQMISREYYKHWQLIRLWSIKLLGQYMAKTNNRYIKYIKITWILKIEIDLHNDQANTFYDTFHLIGTIVL